jgi:hypothetical protein
MTLDDDVAKALRAVAQERGEPLKQVVNDTLRLGSSRHSDRQGCRCSSAVGARRSHLDNSRRARQETADLQGRKGRILPNVVRTTQCRSAPAHRCHRAKNFADAERWDLEFWQSMTPEERLSALVAIRQVVELVEAGRNVEPPER